MIVVVYTLNDQYLITVFQCHFWSATRSTRMRARAVCAVRHYKYIICIILWFRLIVLCKKLRLKLTCFMCKDL